MEHAIITARARVLAEPGVDALRSYASEPRAHGFDAAEPAKRAGALYGAVLSHMRLRDFSAARSQLALQ